MQKPRLYLGTMTFGWNQASSVVDLPVARQLVSTFQAAGGVSLDTARIYSGGACENIVGQAAAGAAGVLIGTKAHPSQPGGLSPDGIQSQIDKSLAELGATSVEEYYLHQPDTEHPLLDSLRHVHALVQRGVVKKLGLSNYNASEVARCFALCQEHGLTKPSVYQGLYNPLNRMVEDDLLPLLKQHGCAFIAYNPLAAGLLTGKHAGIDQVAAGRFKDNPNYMPRFYTPANFKALETLSASCEKHGLGLVEATYRWLMCHSALDGSKGDGVLIGASSLSQLEDNLKAAAGPAPLPVDTADAFARAYATVLEGGPVFPYWRSYSQDMPGREGLDQGASYNANKTSK